MTSATLSQRLMAVEERRPDLDASREVDRMRAAMGGSRAAILTGLVTLWACHGLRAEIAREAEQTRGTKR